MRLLTRFPFTAYGNRQMTDKTSETVSQINAYAPPSNLNPRGRSIWRSCLTARRRELWDAPALDLLAMMCRTWQTWEQIQDKLEQMEPDWPDYGQLIRLADLLAGRAATLATKLRLTPQSLDKKTAGTNRRAPHRIDFGGLA